MSAQRRLLFVVLAGSVVAAAVGVLAARGPDLRDDGVVPVVLVHGYGGDSSMMSVLAARLEAAGHEVVPVDLPLRGIGDIKVSVATVARAVEATLAPDVDVVGFSAGGVVARAYAGSVDEEDRPRVVVTLGSPHHGAEIAGRAASAGSLCTGACAQLAPGSAFLEELNEPDETPPGPRFVSVWTQGDEVVTPPESAVLEGAVNVRVQDVCPGSDAGHVDLVRDPVALGLVLRALEGGLEAPPDTRECEAVRRAGAGT